MYVSHIAVSGYVTQRIFFLLNVFLKEKGGVENWTKKIKWKNGFLTALPKDIKKDPTLSIRKDGNELKVHEKTGKTAIKQDLRSHLHPLITLFGTF